MKTLMVKSNSKYKIFLAKWHGKPKNKEHVGEQPEVDWNKRQEIVSKKIANCKNIFVIAETGREFPKLPFLFMV